MSSAKLLSFDFRQPHNKGELLAFLGIQESLLDEAINKPYINKPAEPEEHDNGITTLRMPSFMRHSIPKKSLSRKCEYRTVWQAHDHLADVYKAFARRFDLFLSCTKEQYPHHSAYGYVRGRSTIGNASPHCGKSLILHADIQNFFPAISSERILNKFIELGIQEEVANILTLFVTIDGSLPLGLHPSPVLANLVCIELDNKLSDLADRYDCSYTRYADDISISGNSNVPSQEEIKKLLGEEGFILSERKFRITKPGQAHYITGLSVTDNNFPRAPRVMKKRLRQELYYCRKYGIAEHLAHLGEFPDFIRRGVNRIDGTVRYVAHIEENASQNLRQEWAELLERDSLEPSYATIEERMARNAVLYIDESELGDIKDSSLTLALSIATTYDCNKIEVNTAKILREHLVHPFADGKKEELEKKKLHYGDATPDLRKSYVDYLSSAPFRGYVAFSSLKTYEDYEDVYLSLLRSLLSDRFMGCDGERVLIIFEGNTKVGSQKLKATVQEVYDALVKTSNRRPISAPAVVTGQKNEYFGFSIPDFLLGVWSDYTKKHKTARDRPHLHFESLRDKYRIILDTDKNIVFSRKRPFFPEYWNQN